MAMPRARVRGIAILACLDLAPGRVLGPLKMRQSAFRYSTTSIEPFIVVG